MNNQKKFKCGTKTNKSARNKNTTVTFQIINSGTKKEQKVTTVTNYVAINRIQRNPHIETIHFYLTEEIIHLSKLHIKKYHLQKKFSHN